MREARSERQRALVGLTDVTLKFPKDLLTFAAPCRMYREMKSNVEGSFLEKHNRKGLLDRNLAEQ